MDSRTGAEADQLGWSPGRPGTAIEKTVWFGSGALERFRYDSNYNNLPPFGTIQLAFERGAAEFGQESTQGTTLFLKVSTVL